MLQELGRSPSTVKNYVPFIDQFLLERFQNRTPDLASLRANLVGLEELLGQRLKAKERLGGMLQLAFQANQEVQRLFAPWLQVMEMQITRSLQEAKREGSEAGSQAGRDLAGMILLERSAQAAQRGFLAVIDQMVQTATVGEKVRLPIVQFQLRRNLDDLDAKALGDFIILADIYESRGEAIAVSDEALMSACRDMARFEGIFAAPEGGAGLAAIQTLVAQRKIARDESVVLFNTGSGYKYLEAWQASFRT